MEIIWRNEDFGWLFVSYSTSGAKIFYHSKEIQYFEEFSQEEESKLQISVAHVLNILFKKSWKFREWCTCVSHSRRRVDSPLIRSFGNASAIVGKVLNNNNALCQSSFKHWSCSTCKNCTNFKNCELCKQYFDGTYCSRCPDVDDPKPFDNFLQIAVRSADYKFVRNCLKGVIFVPKPASL